MKKWGLHASKKALSEMWHILDSDASGTMTFSEFADGVVGNYSVRVFAHWHWLGAWMDGRMHGRQTNLFPVACPTWPNHHLLSPALRCFAV